MNPDLDAILEAYRERWTDSAQPTSAMEFCRTALTFHEDLRDVIAEVTLEAHDRLAVDLVDPVGWFLFEVAAANARDLPR